MARVYKYFIVKIVNWSTLADSNKYNNSASVHSATAIVRGGEWQLGTMTRT